MVWSYWHFIIIWAIYFSPDCSGNKTVSSKKLIHYYFQVSLFIIITLNPDRSIWRQKVS